MKARFTLGTFALLGVFLLANASALSAAPPAAYRIAGIIVDSVTAQPLDGADVTITSVGGSNDIQTFLTSSDGRFLFTNLPAGKYQLMASRRGYATQALLQHEAYSTGIVVGPGLDSEHIRFPLAPSSLITGVVTDEWGDPVRDAKVLLFHQSLFDGSRTLRNVNQTTTDDQGRYRFAHLLSGTYAVAVYARPWYTQDQGQYDVFTTEHPLPISSGDVVVDNSSQPSSSATQNPLFDAVYPVSFFPGVTTLAEAGRLTLRPGATESADFQLHPVPSVHLRVRVPVVPKVPVTVTSQDGDQDSQDGQDKENQAQALAEATLMNISPDIALTLKIGEGFSNDLEPTRKEIAPGLIELSGVPPGELNMAMASFRGSVLGKGGIDYESRAKTLNVSGDTEVDFSSQGGSTNISGVVLSSQFHPAPAKAEQSSGDQPSTPRTVIIQAMEAASSNMTLAFRSLKTGESYNAAISSEGKFSFAGSALPAGPYEVEFPPLSNLHVSGLEAAGATVSGRSIEIPAGQPVNITVHADEATCSLSGFALKNGKPVAGAMVLLVPQDPGHDTSLYRRDQSDSDGSFTMPSIFPGRYILLAIENGWYLEWADPKVMLQYLPAGLPLELHPNASLTLNPKVQ